MTTQVRVRPQLRLGEELLENGTLESLYEDAETLTQRYAGAKGYLNDYLELHPLADGEYRVGRFRVGVETKRKYKTSIPKGKATV